METLLKMEQTKSFFDMAEKEGSVFEPNYTSDFKSFLENSMRQSDSANRDAFKTASVLVINC